MPRSRACGCAIWHAWAAPARLRPAEPASTVPALRRDAPARAPQRRSHGITPLAEAEDELRVLGHLLRRPGRIPGELDLDVVDAWKGAHDLVDLLLDHRPDGTAHGGQRVDDLHAAVLELHVVHEPEIDDVHAELRVLDLAEGLDDLF